MEREMLSSNSLLLLLQRYLAGGELVETAEVMKRELERIGAVPKRIDFEGKEHPQSFDEWSAQFSVLPQDYFFKTAKRFMAVMQRMTPPSLPAMSARFCFVPPQAKGPTEVGPSAGKEFTVNIELPKPRECENMALQVRSREMGLLNRRPASKGSILTKTAMCLRMRRHCRILGHLASIFCACFDRTGRYVFTGADDKLVKAWLVEGARLVFTFRGCGAEVNDLNVNHENTLLAAASVDRTVRIWELRTGATVKVLQHHTATVTSCLFSPFTVNSIRCIVTTGNDGAIGFWAYDADTLTFEPEPYVYLERSRPGMQMLSLAASPGGRFIAAGSTDKHVRIYLLHTEPERVAEIEAHKERVDSLSWSHKSIRFASGSKDGTAKIWYFERRQWRNMTLALSNEEMNIAPQPTLNDQLAHVTKVKVLGVEWTQNDDFLVTSYTDKKVRLWNTRTGELVRKLQIHDELTYAFHSTKLQPDVMLSAGYDGCVVLWNPSTGQILRRFYNHIEGQGHGTFLDCKFSPTGQTVAAVDSNGYLSVYCLASQNTDFKYPQEQFFHTDFRPVIHDDLRVIDAQTGMEPHLMPPAFLVNSDGAPYEPVMQRRVPGRESCPEVYLTPRVVMLPMNESSDDESVNLEDVTPETAGVDIPDFEPLTCPWVTRSIVPPLSEAERMHSAKMRESLGQIELECYERERSKAPTPTAPEEGPQTSRSRRRRPKHAHGYGTRRTDAQDRGQPSTEQPEQDPATAAVSPSLSYEGLDLVSSDSDDEDYEDHSRSIPKPKRRRPRRRGDTEQDENALSSVESSSDSSDDNSQEQVVDSDQPSTSAGIVRIRVPKVKSPNKSKDRLHKMSTGSDCDPGPFSDWMKLEAPRRCPYFPQRGDDVVYFVQGHKAYVQAVRQGNLYEVDDEALPWNIFKLRHEEFCRVSCVAWRNEPFRLASVKLNVYNKETGKSDRIRVEIDDHWWFGTVQSDEPLDVQFPLSPFQKYMVRWDNDDLERLCPWDMQPCPPGRGLRRSSQQLKVDEMEELTHYSHVRGDWPADYIVERERISDGIQKLMGYSFAEQFCSPVDVLAFSEYLVCIQYPMDLALILRRLEKNFYRRQKALLDDVAFIEVNAKLFNERAAPIVRNAKRLYEVVSGFIQDKGSNDIRLFINQSPDVKVVPPPSRHKKKHKKSRRRRSQSNSEDSDSAPTTFAWRDECRRIIDVLLDKQDSRPFKNHEDEKTRASFYSIIDEPVDLKMVRARLSNRAADRYQSPEECALEVRGIFEQARMMSSNRRDQTVQCAQRLQPLFNELIEPIESSWARAHGKRTAPQPPSQHVYETRTRHPVPALRPQLEYKNAPKQKVDSPRPRRSSANNDSTENDDSRSAPSTSTSHETRSRTASRNLKGQLKSEESASTTEEETVVPERSTRSGRTSRTGSRTGMAGESSQDGHVRRSVRSTAVKNATYKEFSSGEGSNDESPYGRTRRKRKRYE